MRVSHFEKAEKKAIRWNWTLSCAIYFKVNLFNLRITDDSKKDDCVTPYFSKARKWNYSTHSVCATLHVCNVQNNVRRQKSNWENGKQKMQTRKISFIECKNFCLRIFEEKTQSISFVGLAISERLTDEMHTKSDCARVKDFHGFRLDSVCVWVCVSLWSVCSREKIVGVKSICTSSRASEHYWIQTKSSANGSLWRDLILKIERKVSVTKIKTTIEAAKSYLNQEKQTRT